MVVRRENETVDSLIKRFKADVEKSGIVNEIRKREYYIPPSQKRKLKHENAMKRMIAEERKRNKFYDKD